MLTTIAFLVTIGLLVTVHEFGHYQVAKWCGIKVLKFSIGFGKPLCSKTLVKNGTEFILAAIPLGGYVKFLDEREFSEQEQASQYSEDDLKRAFNRQSVLKRMAVVLAGPFANLLLAIALYWVLLMMGVLGIKPILGGAIQHSPAALAGFKSNETINKINDYEVDTWQEASFLFLNESLKNKTAQVEVLDENQTIQHRTINLASIDFDKANQDVMNLLGFTEVQTHFPVRIADVQSGGSANKAGMKINDLIIEINQHKIDSVQDFVDVINQNPNQPIDIFIKRGAEHIVLKVTPDAKKVGERNIGVVGVAAQDSRLTKIDYSAGRALTKAAGTTWDTSVMSLKLMGKLVTGQLSLKNMSGPLTIANAAGDSAEKGLKQFIGFLAFISISIGVMNLLPIPVLDGGHFMYYMAELLTGKAVPESAMILGQKIGFLLLGLMMLVAFYNDINRLITG